MESINKPMPSVSILIVEDDEDSKNILVAILEKKYPDFTTHTANNGKTGSELFKELLPDIVITDINMPELNGVQMANKIRVLKPEAKIIVLTADTGKATMEHAVGKEFEIDHYILKPVDFGKLFAAIEQCVDGITKQHDQ